METAKVDITVKRVVIVNNTGDNDWNRTIAERVNGITKKAYSWSKYGGKNLGLVQEVKTPEWTCQACGDRQTSELPAYMFEFSENEFIRICSTCQALKITKHLKSLDDLLQLVRKTLQPWY